MSPVRLTISPHISSSTVYQVAESKSAPSVLTTPAWQHPARFYWPGTDEFRQQDEDDQLLLQQIRSRPSHVSPETAKPTPILPDFLILNIFRLAVQVPGALDTNDSEDIQLFTRLHIWDARHPGLAVSRHTCYSLMLLSKQWNLATRQFGYQHIRIRSSKQLAVFVHLLKQGSDHADEYPTPGACVRRLDLNVNPSWRWGRTDYQMLKAVFTMCPNLSCFSTIGSRIPPSNIGLPAFLTSIPHLAPSLKRLELVVDQNVLRALHNSSLNIAVLWIVPAVTLDENTDEEVYTFPSVQTLVAAKGTENWVRTFELPSLSAIFMEDGTVEDIPVKEWSRTMMQHVAVKYSWDMVKLDNERLKGISIKYSEISKTAIKWPTQLSESEVQHLTIYDMPTSWSFKPIHSIGARNSAHILQENFRQLIGAENFPCLQRVRLLVGVDMAGVLQLPPEMKRIWKNWVALCRDTGIAVEVLPDGRCANQGAISTDDL
ncbi:hypothetical protein CVT24_006815 [Panaeolus cyanescens]|uniref:Uncharacterized protein n=1 Tax=Panaeolus cyanescens TaxID=181874 RepID=A0A409VDQ8_9AGAR|nr:hypothetical protein CVT24_006815 [Panaeolus cyanescens]